MKENNITTIKVEFKCLPEWKNIDPIGPALHALPKWYKDKKAHYGENPTPHDISDGTIKACPPMFDSMIQGYILPLWVDLYVEPVEDVDFGTIPNFFWGEGVAGELINIFAPETTQGMPGVDKTGVPAYKINSPWTVRTPKGYSTLYVPPLNNKDPLFEAMSGIVHTDVYSTFVNIPFIWTGPADFKGVIKRGTPLIQLIPFKREEFTYELGVISPEHKEEMDACMHYPEGQFGGGYRNITNQLVGGK